MGASWAIPFLAKPSASRSGTSRGLGPLAQHPRRSIGRRVRYGRRSPLIKAWKTAVNGMMRQLWMG